MRLNSNIKFARQGFINYTAALLITLGSIILLTSYWLIRQSYQEYSQSVSPIACTQEAIQCGDGSYVGRTGPNCEFAACPSEEEINPEGYTSQADCEQKTGKKCGYGMCDVIPLGKTVEELCGKFRQGWMPLPIPQPIGCSEEAKQCPDGSYVRRNGPNCEFAACSGGDPKPTIMGCTDDAKKCADGSFVLRTGPKCEFTACPR